MSGSGKSSLLFWFLMLLGAACIDKKETQKPISLEPVKSVSELNDSTFFGGIGAMKFANNRLYLADNLNQVLQLGSDMELHGLINKSGRGPGEFTGLMDICIVNDSLYLYDRQQAKILVYDLDNNFIREIGLLEAGGFNMAVDHHGRIFLSTPSRTHPITKLSANGQEILAFGNNTVHKDSRHFLRNSRFLFIHNDKLIAIAMSEPELEIYSLEGELISKADIAPPEIHDLIARAKRENEGQGIQQSNVTFLSNIFFAAAIYKNNIYLLEAKKTNENTNTYDTNFTYLFKYKFEPDGDVILEQTFRLFHSDREELLYGFRLAAIGEHKLIVYDLSGGSLLVFQHNHL